MIVVNGLQIADAVEKGFIVDAAESLNLHLITLIQYNNSVSLNLLTLTLDLLEI